MQTDIINTIQFLGTPTSREIAEHLGIEDQKAKWRMADTIKRMRRNGIIEATDERPYRYILLQSQEDRKNAEQVHSAHPVAETATDNRVESIQPQEEHTQLDVKLDTLDRLASITAPDIAMVLCEIRADIQSQPQGQLDELAAKVLTWSTQRGIIHHSTAQAQLIKAMEELGELAADIARGRDINDSLGDTMVCLINIAALEGTSLEAGLRAAYDEIKDRKGHMTQDGVFVKEAA